jgi:peptidoglycan/LPS O-acetylase OafA/YrhL
MGGGMQLSSSTIAWVQTLTLTQWLTLLWHPSTYASGNSTLCVAAFWSLNYEEQFYLVIGAIMLVATRFGWPIIWGVLALMIPAFVWNLTYPAISYGFFLEYWVHFGLGTLVFYRLCRMTNAKVRWTIDVSLLILMLGSGAVWALNRGPGFLVQRSVFAEWFICSAFALFLLGFRSVDEILFRTWWGSKLAQLGLLTYSLYLVHQFNLQIADEAAKLLFRVGIPQFFKIPVEFTVIVIIAAVFWYFCERPFMNRPLDQTARAKDVLVESTI